MPDRKGRFGASGREGRFGASDRQRRFGGSGREGRFSAPGREPVRRAVRPSTASMGGEGGRRRAHHQTVAATGRTARCDDLRGSLAGRRRRGRRLVASGGLGRAPGPVNRYRLGSIHGAHY
ncbi:hypothetical protein Q0Z83_002800 [Actinoplanes sichuanensis]|nr:hypothetical protein Q0Z83_002800 [Actinoplanes sichuanensis]